MIRHLRNSLGALSIAVAALAWTAYIRTRFIVPTMLLVLTACGAGDIIQVSQSAYKIDSERLLIVGVQTKHTKKQFPKE